MRAVRGFPATKRASTCFWIDSMTMNRLAAIQLCPLLISRLATQVCTDASISASAKII